VLKFKKKIISAPKG